MPVKLKIIFMMLMYMNITMFSLTFKKYIAPERDRETETERERERLWSFDVKRCI